MKGEYPLQNPRSNPTLFSSHWVNLWLHSGLHCSWCYGGEGGHSKSRGGGLHAPARGPGPLAPARGAGHPMKGAHPLQNPRSHPTLFSRYWMRRWLHSGLHCPWCYGGEGGHSKSRGGGLRAPARGAGPLAPSLRAGHPMKGAHPLQNPRSHPTLFYGWWMASWLHSVSHCSWCCGGEGGIRTHGPLPVNGFRDRPIRPLSHLSVYR